MLPLQASAASVSQHRFKNKNENTIG